MASARRCEKRIFTVAMQASKPTASDPDHRAAVAGLLISCFNPTFERLDAGLWGTDHRTPDCGNLGDNL